MLLLLHVVLLTDCFFTTSEALCSDNAGNLSCCTPGMVGFLPNTNWYGENPCTFVNVFFALAAHATAQLTLHLVSSRSFSTISTTTPLWRSQRPLLHGDSAAVVFRSIPNFWADPDLKDLLNDVLFVFACNDYT